MSIGAVSRSAYFWASAFETQVHLCFVTPNLHYHTGVQIHASANDTSVTFCTLLVAQSPVFAEWVLRPM